jgi:hypothetical protein
MCLNCNDHSTPNSANTKCLCNAGFSASNSSNGSVASPICSSCMAGKFKFIGNAACMPCAAGSYPNALASATECVGCEKGKYSQANDAVSSAVCQSCPYGTYMDSTGATACVGCPQSPVKTSAAAGSVSSDSCREVVVVKLRLEFPISPSEFKEQQAQFAKAIASASGVPGTQRLPLFCCVTLDDSRIDFV